MKFKDDISSLWNECTPIACAIDYNNLGLAPVEKEHLAIRHFSKLLLMRSIEKISKELSDTNTLERIRSCLEDEFNIDLRENHERSN